MILKRMCLFFCFLAFAFPSSSQPTTLSFASINILDSLIHSAPSLALLTADYNHLKLDSMILRQKPLDSVAIYAVAQSFFKDLRDGNRKPNLFYQGLKIDRKNINLTSNFKSLANHLIN